MSLQGMGRMSRANPSQDLPDHTVTPTCEVCQLPPNNFKPQLSLGAGRPAQLSSCSPHHSVCYLAKLYCQLGIQEDVSGDGAEVFLARPPCCHLVRALCEGFHLLLRGHLMRERRWCLWSEGEWGSGELLRWWRGGDGRRSCPRSNSS